MKADIVYNHKTRYLEIENIRFFVLPEFGIYLDKYALDLMEKDNCAFLVLVEKAMQFYINHIAEIEIINKSIRIDEFPDSWIYSAPTRAVPKYEELKQIHKEVLYHCEKLNIAYDSIVCPDWLKEKLLVEIINIKDYIKQIENKINDKIERTQYKKKNKLNNKKFGYNYLLGSELGYYKIGKSKYPGDRVYNIQLPFEVELLHCFPTDNMGQSEAILKNKYRECNVKGEWFILSDEQKQEIINIKRYKDCEFIIG